MAPARPFQFRQAVGVEEPKERDGRRLRSQDSRARIVAAMLELVHAGEVSPSAEQVASRAEVGLRTVFRHFKDMDSLYAEMAQVIEAELRAMYFVPFKSEDWQGRLIELIDRRAALFERIAPFRRASDANRHRSRFGALEQARVAGMLRDIMKDQLPPEVVRDPLKLEALDVLLSYECWARLRGDQGLTPRRAREVIAAAARKIAG
jgi:AcrR family transcriptional regulator